VFTLKFSSHASNWPQKPHELKITKLRMILNGTISIYKLAVFVVQYLVKAVYNIRMLYFLTSKISFLSSCKNFLLPLISKMLINKHLE
jgi:hypothetical protein